MSKTTWIPVGVMLVCLLLVVCVVAPPWEKGFFDRGGSPQSADPVAEVPSSTAAPGPAPDGMVWIPPGQFNMGSDDGFPDEQPIHKVVLDGFWLDATEVTNAQFRRFVEATGYVTIAEKKPKREDFIGEIPDVNAIPEENLIAGSVCYNPDFDRTTLRKDSPLWPYQVWRYVAGANWCHPQGPDSSIEGLDDHPVVHVSHADAIAYCDWAKKRLPTEAEWEYAARGGKVGQLYPWGNTLCADGNWQTNIWQGDFPNENSAADGFITTAPVKQFSATEWGLYGMSGNVWEWCADFYRPDYYAKSARQNPLGPQESYDPNEPGVIKRIQRGGSFLCSDNYCTGYRVSARMKGEPRTGTYHCGFRCARSSAR